ncbi:MAG TPA: general secretion pathway protein GspB [Rhodanobacteraceae bacterium]|nr:general secretion pathway protein GspB [Rhodanobacteraceae bacterium]
MSLILEALKKSEQQRRLGEAPTLGSPVVSTRRRRSALPVILVLIVVAAGAGWWLTRKPAEPPAASAQPVSADRSAPGKPPVAGETKPPQTAAAAQERLKQEAAARRQIQQAKRGDALGNAKPNAPLGLPGTPNQATMPPGRKPGDPLSHTVPGMKTPPQPAPAGANAIPPKTDATAAAAAPKPGAGTPPPAAAPAPAPETASATPPPAPAKAPAAGAPDAATLPTIWDLPFATRKDIPALELSMHVYSSDPKQRFVVIKGERHVEGDEIASDLTLREIRQDGLVLDFKGQKFFFPRNGR